MKLLTALVTAATLLSACGRAPEGASTEGQPEVATGFLELPLESSAEDGTPVRLVGAALQLETPTDTVPVVAPSDEGVFSQALPLDLERVVLTGPWHLESMEAGEWRPLTATLGSTPVWEAPQLADGEVTEIGFRFETPLGSVSFGQP